MSSLKGRFRQLHIDRHARGTRGRARTNGKHWPSSGMSLSSKSVTVWACPTDTPHPKKSIEGARENAKPILAWIKDHGDTSEREGRLNCWNGELLQFHSTGMYTSPDGLAPQVEASPRSLAVSESTA